MTWQTQALTDPAPELTMVDVAAAVVRDHGADEADPALNVLSLIARSMEADRQMFDGWREKWADQDRAEMLALRHGVTAALARSEWGGPTREYEKTLNLVCIAVNDAGDKRSAVNQWYRDMLAERREAGDFFPGSEPDDVYPPYRVTRFGDM